MTKPHVIRKIHIRVMKTVHNN